MEPDFREKSNWERGKQAARLSALAARLTWQAGPRLLLGMLSLLLVQSLLPTLDLVLAKALVDRAALDLGVGGSSPALAERLPLLGWIGLAVAALTIGQLIGPVSTTFQSLLGDRLTGHITERILLATNRWQGIARFEDAAFADDMKRARDRASWAGLDVLLHVCELVLALFTVAGLAVTVARLDPLVPILLIGATLPHIAMQLEFGYRTGSHLYWATPDARRLEYSRDTTLAIEPAKDVRLYGLGPLFRRQYDARFDDTTGRLDDLRRRLTPRTALAGALAGIAAAGVYLYVVREVANGRLTVGDLALYGGAATLLQARLLEAGQIFGFMPFQAAFLPSLFRVLDAPPDLPRPADPNPAPRTIREGFVFEHVGFTYSGSDAPVLHDVSFALGPRESLALVGHNGAGKTTIVKLLLRLYDPTAGRILLNGVDLREYDLDDLRTRTAVVFQDFVRYELKANENIGLGALDALDDDPRLLRAVADAGGGDLIDELPDGLRTQLGRRFGGRELSEGQWQKLALARAFVRDAPILVLDEPTAALDVQTEHDVYARFHDLTRDRMTLLISHRFSTVRMADRILFLAGGRIAEEGSHAALMARDETYARLYRLQASRYERAATNGDNDG